MGYAFSLLFGGLGTGLVILFLHAESKDLLILMTSAVMLWCSWSIFRDVTL